MRREAEALFLLLIAALITIVGGCTQIVPAVPVNNITLNQRFEIGDADPLTGGGETSEPTAGATDSAARAGPCSVAISNDVWIAGTTASANPSSTVSTPISASVPISTGGAATSTQPPTPAEPATPTRP